MSQCPGQAGRQAAQSRCLPRASRAEPLSLQLPQTNSHGAGQGRSAHGASELSVRSGGRPGSGGHHLGLTIRGAGNTVTLTLTGQAPAGPVLFQLPAFVRNIAHASTGTVDESTVTVTLAPSARGVTVTLTRPAG